MGNDSWVLMVTAQTPTNIAVIKYWGKRDENLILPINDSISVTLDPSHLCTTTTVAVSPAFTQDRMWLNGKVGYNMHILFLSLLVIISLWCIVGSVLKLQIFLGFFFFPFYDSVWWFVQEISLSGGRYQNCLREIRSRASDIEDEKKGIKIAKKDWEKLHLHIASYNNFPTAAGLASSAAGFACLGNLFSSNQLFRFSTI